MRALVERALQFERDCIAAACDRVDEHPLGLWTRCSEHPKMWMLNQLHVIGPRPELTADDLIAEVDRGLDDARHRRAQVADDATGRRLAGDLGKREGWTAAPVAVMALDREPPEPRPGVAREVDAATMLAVDERFIAEEENIPEDDKVPVVAGLAHAVCAVAGTRFFVGADDGADACAVTLFGDGRTGQVEDVETLTAHRGRGLASATVSLAARASAAAGCDLTFLVCNAATGPVPLYASLGFRVIGRYWAFTRPA